MKRPGNLGFVTDSPLFDEPQPGSHEWDLQQRGIAQQAMEAGRPLTMAEMHGGKQQQLFRTLGADEPDYGQRRKMFTILGVSLIALLHYKEIAAFLKSLT